MTRRVILGGMSSDEQQRARWVRSSASFSNGNCVEVAAPVPARPRPPGWRTSSHSIGNGDCAEVRDGPAVRDSKDPRGPVLTFTPASWAAFTGRLKAS